MKVKTEQPTAICPNCTGLKTYSNTPGFWRCISCGAVWERPRFTLGR